MSSLSWLGTTLCPPDCLVKSDVKAPSCTTIFLLGIVVLQCVRAGKVFCGLHVAHMRIICPVCDVTHVRKCTRPSPALPYCKQREAGRGPGNEATFVSKGREMPKPVPTKAFLQPAKAAAMCTVSRAETHPHPTFFASAKPIFKTDCAN